MLFRSPEISTRGEEAAVAQNSNKSLPKIEQLEIVEKSTTESVLRQNGDRPWAGGQKPEKFKISEIRGILSAPRSPPRNAVENLAGVPAGPESRCYPRCQMRLGSQRFGC